MRLAIFCTGGAKLGFGHFFRSKTFAKAAPPNFTVLLVPVIDVEDRHFFKDVLQITTLCDNEATALAAIMAFKPDVMVFDAVNCSGEFFVKAKKSSRFTVSISPVFNNMTGVDCLFTRNIHTPPIGEVKIYKGFEYVVFNEHCKVIPDEVYEHNMSREFLTVGVAMGGGDAPNKTLQVLKSVSRVEAPCTFWILLGEGYKHSYQDLVDTIRKDSNHEIILAKTNRSMWNVLSNCTVAIFAGGLTTMEAAYAGLPSLNIFEKEDHLNATGRQLFELGIAEDMGLFRDASLDRLAERVRYLNDNKHALLDMRKNSKGKLDKLGPARIYKKMEDLIEHRDV